MHLVLGSKDLQESLETEMTEVNVELSVAKRSQQGRSKVEVSSPHLKDRHRWRCQEDRPGMDASTENT